MNFWPHLMTAVPCLPSTPVPSTHCKRWTKVDSYPLAINIFEFPDDVRLISLKSCFNACLTWCLKCQVTVLSILKFKKTCMQKVYFREENLFTRPTTSWMQVSCNSHWAINAVVFNGMLLEFSPLLRLQPAAERNLITALTRNDKLEIGGWWVYGVRQLICQCQQSHGSYGRDGRMDGQTDGRLFSFIAILALYLPYVQGLFTITNNGNFTTCTCSSIQ